MYQKIRSFWLALWAGFLRFMYLDQPRKEDLMDPNREEILDFIKLLRSLGNRESYKALVDAAQANYRPMTTEDWVNILDQVKEGVHQGAPGHGFGHTQRDWLDTVVLATDKNAQTFQPAEIDAAIKVMLHDFGVAFVPRYRDTEWLAGHAESGAWRVYKKLHGLIEENQLLIICYAIAAHTHYLKPLTCKDGSIREPWWYEIFESDGKKYGWAILACRFGDRLDTNGTTLLLRHLLANSDAVESGGQDLSATSFYDINHDSIRIMVSPKKAMMALPDGKLAPTTPQHVYNFAGSNFANSVYSRDDHLFPTMSRLMGYKVAQSTNIAIIANKPVSPWEVLKVSLGIVNPTKDLKKLLYRADRSPRFDNAWTVLCDAFSELSTEELAIWANIIAYLDTSYDLWLEVLRAHIVDNSNEFTNPILPLLDGIIAEVS